MSHIKYLLIASLVAAFSLPASPAAAKGGKRSKAKTSTTARANKTRAKVSTASTAVPGQPKTKNYDFLADDIDGSRVMPDDTTIFGREDVTHNSLIRLRTEFIAEIVKSAEML